MGSNRDVSHSLEFQAMGSTISILSNRAQGYVYWEKAMQKIFEQVEQTASRFRADSELMNFNRSEPMTAFNVSPIFHQMLERAWHYATSTNYYFQPFIGSAIAEWGYDRSFEHITTDFTKKPAQMQSYSHVPQLLFEKEQLIVKRTTAHHLDLGGIGKGWTAAWASTMLRNVFDVHTGCVDAGGDIVVWSADQPWIIGVQDAFAEDKQLTQLHLHQGAIATSNTLFRRWSSDGTRVHHIFHGQTGSPVNADIVQATVIGPQADEAEVAAKIMCMLGSSQAVPFMKQRFPHLGFLYVHESGDVQLNRKLWDYVERVA